MNIKVLAALVAMCAVFLGGLAYRPAATLSQQPDPAAMAEMNDVPASAETILPQETTTPQSTPEEVLVAENTKPEPQATTTLPPELADHGWEKRVGTGRGVWVSVSAQRLSLLEGAEVIWSGTCATAANGVGAEMGSQKTPLGWHAVAEKMGEDAPWGQVFRSRVPTREIWKPGGSTKEDLVLTRVLWLDGLEPGRNKGKNAAGKNVDSKERCIYIHGTNAEQLLGTPSSHGCIRLKNDDVIKVYDLIPVGTPVLITE